MKHVPYLSRLPRLQIALLILRWALAFSFIYAALMAFFHPFDWIGFFPAFIRDNFPDVAVLNLFGLSQIIIAGWLVWGKHLFISSSIATIYLAGIVIFNLSQFEILFRDVSIMGMSLALAVMSYPRNTGKGQI